MLRMNIEFPRYVEYRIFYRFILDKFISFLSSTDDKLVIYLDRTEHITPGVLCDMLTFFKYQHVKKGAYVFLVFGNATRLRSYLNETGFFLHSEIGSLFQTDITDYSLSFSNKGRYINQIHRVNIPIHKIKSKVYLPYHIQNEFIKSVIDLYNSKSKQMNMANWGLIDIDNLASGFSEIIENAYGYAYSSSDSCFYYSFQNYLKTGLSLVCSDFGTGYYSTLLSKFIYTDELDAGIDESSQLRKHDIPVPIRPKLFKKSEFQAFAKDERRKNLAAILECILIHIDDLQVNGFPYILRTLILPANGILRIHCENTLINIDRQFIYDFFQINNDSTLVANKQKLRSIVMDFNIQDILIDRGILQLYPHVFPGVHISVEIGSVQDI